MNGSVTVSENPEIVITSITPVQPSCFGSVDGVITITASGGTGALDYSINNGVTYQPSYTFGSLPQGTYDIVVKDSRGCTKSAVQILTQPVALNASVTAQTNITCFGGNTGSVTVTATAGTGTAPYQYSINGGVTWQGNGTFSHSYSFNVHCTR